MLGRALWLVSALGVAGCTTGPVALGITGPNPTGQTPSGNYGAVAIPSVTNPDDAAVLPPGQPVDEGGPNAPSVVPTYGPNGRYYGL